MFLFSLIPDVMFAASMPPFHTWDRRTGCKEQSTWNAMQIHHYFPCSMICSCCKHVVGDRWCVCVCAFFLHTHVKLGYCFILFTFMFHWSLLCFSWVVFVRSWWMCLYGLMILMGCSLCFDVFDPIWQAWLIVTVQSLEFLRGTKLGHDSLPSMFELCKVGIVVMGLYVRSYSTHV